MEIMVQSLRATDPLVGLALETLPKMVVPQRRAFCFQFTRDNSVPEFSDWRSWRYSIICLLGLVRAEQSGLKTKLDLDDLLNAICDVASHQPIGDLALLLFLALRMESPRSAELAKLLKVKLQCGKLDSVEGLQMAWLVLGLTVAAHSGTGDLEREAERVADYFLLKRFDPSGIPLHYGNGFRSRFPNFATMAYTLQTLSIRARLASDGCSLKKATVLFGHYRDLQRPNGGWPWLYNAKSATVLEPFEIYSVHQHGMAPMALLEYSETTGVDVSPLLRKSVAWLETNELNFPMVDRDTGVIYRSIRRKQPFDRLVLYRRVAGAVLGSSVPVGKGEDPGGLEVQFTCRSYELGWLLEAWCGRKLL